MKKLLLFLTLLFLTGLVQAAPTDGNYTLTQYNLDGGGNVATDTNYIAFASAGEPIVLQNTSDNNAAMAAGVWGTPFLKVLLEVVAPVVEKVARTILVVLGDSNNALIPIFIVIMLAGFALFYMFFKKKVLTGKEAKENG